VHQESDLLETLMQAVVAVVGVGVAGVGEMPSEA